MGHTGSHAIPRCYFLFFRRGAEQPLAVPVFQVKIVAATVELFLLVYHNGKGLFVVGRITCSIINYCTALINNIYLWLLNGRINKTGVAALLREALRGGSRWLAWEAFARASLLLLLIKRIS